MKLSHHNYGKARVRVMKVSRRGRRHSLKELEVSVMLQGDFDPSYTKADNSLVVPTDTMKNTVNILAKQKLGAENEDFAVVLARHFVHTYRQVHRVEVRVSEHCWERMVIKGHQHPHSFIEQGAARPFAEVVATRKELTIQSGIEDLLVLKTTESGFAGFAKDQYTTLPETTDRILATKIKASWHYRRNPSRFSATNARILQAMLHVFAATYSPSVQVTLFQMGEAALAAAPEISSVTLAMPNKHCLLINLSPFGLENHNELFLPTDEPHGQIEATVSRD